MTLARTHSMALVGRGRAIPSRSRPISRTAWSALLLVGLPDTALREARDRIRAGDRQQRGGVAAAPDHRGPVPGQPAQARQQLRPGHRGRYPGRGGRSPRGRAGRAGLPGRAGAGRPAAPGPRRPAGRGRGRGGRVRRRRGARGQRAGGGSRSRACGSSPRPAWLRSRLAARRAARPARRATGWPGGPAPGGRVPRPARTGPARRDGRRGRGRGPAGPDLADVVGQPIARRAAEICAAGGHHLLLLGPPGVGKTMLAERLPTILPRLEPAAALEVTAIHSVAGHAAAGRPADQPSRRSAPRTTPRPRRRSSAAAAASSGPAPPRWRITGACSSTRRRSSPGMCWTRCASRWSPGEVVVARLRAHRAVPGQVHAGARGQPVPVRAAAGSVAAGRARGRRRRGRPAPARRRPPQVPGPAVRAAA